MWKQPKCPLTDEWIKKMWYRDFLGGPVVKTSRFQCRGQGSNPGQGTKIPHAMQHAQNIKKKKKMWNLSPTQTHRIGVSRVGPRNLCFLQVILMQLKLNYHLHAFQIHTYIKQFSVFSQSRFISKEIYTLQ